MRNHCTAASLAALTLGLCVIAAAPASQAQISIGINVNLAPPPLPVEEQPAIPGYGYIWTPGYWAFDSDYNSYYWVPGEWVEPPQVGFYWTPGYWGWNNGAFVFNSGYWGPTVGYYGGVDYGYGYGGRGFEGGEWRGGRLFYNRTVTNLGSRRIGTVFARPVTPITRSRVSFAGGRGGLAVRPTPAELAAARGPRIKTTPEQVRQAHAAVTNPNLRADRVAAKPKIEAGRTLPAKTPVGPAASEGAARPAPDMGTPRPERAHRAVTRPTTDQSTTSTTTTPSRSMSERPNRPATEPGTAKPDRMTGMQRAAPTPQAGPMRAKPEKPQGGPVNSPAREPSVRPQKPAAKPDASKPGSDRKTTPE